MATTLKAPTERTHANPDHSDSTEVRSRLDAVRTHSAKAGIGANPEAPSALLPLIRQAASETGLSQKAMAINAGIPESVLSEALNSRRNFAAEWWWLQPDSFLLRFLDLVTEARQLTPESARLVRANRIKELIGLLLSEVA
jgi:hypothetical protein